MRKKIDFEIVYEFVTKYGYLFEDSHVLLMEGIPFVEADDYSPYKNLVKQHTPDELKAMRAAAGAKNIEKGRQIGQDFASGNLYATGPKRVFSPNTTESPASVSVGGKKGIPAVVQPKSGTVSGTSGGITTGTGTVATSNPAPVRLDSGSNQINRLDKIKDTLWRKRSGRGKAAVIAVPTAAALAVYAARRRALAKRRALQTNSESVTNFIYTKSLLREAEVLFPYVDNQKRFVKIIKNELRKYQ